MFLVPLATPRSHALRAWANGVDRFFDDASRAPNLDLVETPSAYTLTLDLPGVAKEDVDISVVGRRVTIEARSKAASSEKTDSAAADRIVWRERSSANFSRSVVLPVEVDQAGADAVLEHGVLTLTLPKAGAKAQRITVK